MHVRKRIKIEKIERRPVCWSDANAAERTVSVWRMNCMIVVREQPQLSQTTDYLGVDTPPTKSLYLKEQQDAFRTWKKFIDSRREYAEAWHVRISACQL
ncbi:hypothetical protein AVEN_205828-1 [Araneus ventricosus]|uniref:Uncharacterized protein n=1 Tax=Araneus ventricosus TaxID=182803 RepID=A0A4Y2HDU0_ARAVE|nr:hypothetical protein AVEN_205828-1 [Araneus ventricosus]